MVVDEPSLVTGNGFNSHGDMGISMEIEGCNESDQIDEKDWEFDYPAVSFHPTGPIPPSPPKHIPPRPESPPPHLTPDENGTYVRRYPGASQVYAKGTPRSSVLEDKYAALRSQLPYYPFKNEEQMQFAFILQEANLSEALSEALLNSDYVSGRLRGDYKQTKLYRFGSQIKKHPDPLNFTNGPALKGLVSKLPATPQWKVTSYDIPGWPTAQPIEFYWRDGLECIRFLYSNPVYQNAMDAVPIQVFTDAEGKNRLYGEPCSAERIWEIQVSVT